MREHYVANRAYYIAKARDQRLRDRQLMREYLGALKSVPCKDCSRMFPPWAMEFDHVNGDKVLNVSDAARLGRKRLLEEAAKCEIVCSNCHRLRTHNRLLRSTSAAKSGAMLSGTAKRRGGPAKLGGSDRTLA
jgi:hypothetical protein